MAKDRGMTDQQIEAEAQARGINLDEAGDGSTTQQMTDPQIEPVLDESVILDPPDSEMTTEEELVLETTAEPSREATSYYGYQIFQGDPGAFQASTFGAVDPNYNIGPGDQIIVMLWGETQFRQVLTVDREGFVFIPEIGQVFVNGLNLSLLESKLFRGLSQSFASLNPQGRKPTTFLDVSLGNLRPLRIQVLGEVAQPGAYTVSPSATLFSALYYFNGPTTLGSLRDIRLIRGGKELVSIDFYDYLLTGKKPKDHSLSQPPTCSVYPGSNEGSDQLKTHSRLPPESTLSVTSGITIPASVPCG